MSGRLTCHDTSRQFTLGTKLDTDIVDQSGHITHNRSSVDGVSGFSEDGGSMRQLHPDNVRWDLRGGDGAVVERRTRDRKVPGSSPRRSGGRMFFSRRHSVLAPWRVRDVWGGGDYLFVLCSITQK